MKTTSIRNLLIVFTLLATYSNAYAIESCTIGIWSNDISVKHLLYSDTYERGEFIGGKRVTSLKNCNTCYNGGDNEGPALCNSEGGDEYTITCEKNNNAVESRTTLCP